MMDRESARWRKEVMLMEIKENLLDMLIFEPKLFTESELAKLSRAKLTVDELIFDMMETDMKNEQ